MQTYLMNKELVDKDLCGMARYLGWEEFLMALSYHLDLDDLEVIRYNLEEEV